MSSLDSRPARKPSNGDTPMMRQYKALKAKNPDAVMLFRMGDFYELFDDDARQAAPVMELALTQRQGIAMCGLPHHQLQPYMAKLLKAGFHVAVAEQMGRISVIDGAGQIVPFEAAAALELDGAA